MAIDYKGHGTEVISDDAIKRVCPVEYEAFIKFAKELGEENVVWIRYGVQGRAGHPSRNEIIRTYDALTDAFEEKTGLMILYTHHNSEREGSCFDQIEGGFFQVLNAYELTKNAKPFKKDICKYHYVSLAENMVDPDPQWEKDVREMMAK